MIECHLCAARFYDDNAAALHMDGTGISPTAVHKTRRAPGRPTSDKLSGR
jgi:hypothetical protein